MVKPGPSKLHNTLLSQTNIEEVRVSLLRDYDPNKDLWYLTDPITALDIPGRAIIAGADFLTLTVDPLRK